MNQIPFTNRYVTLGEKFYVKTRPSPVADFVPQLGDGRALLLGDLVGPNGVCFDIHLKGSSRNNRGQTTIIYDKR